MEVVYVPPKQQQTFTGLHNVKSQTMDTVHSQCSENLKSDNVDFISLDNLLASADWMDIIHK
jgi:hypothetical protein